LKKSVCNKKPLEIIFPLSYLVTFSEIYLEGSYNAKNVHFEEDTRSSKEGEFASSSVAINYANSVHLASSKTCGDVTTV